MHQETLVILKPDALERNLVGTIIKYYEDAGLRVLDARLYRELDEGLLMRHYPDSMALSVGLKAQRAVPSIRDPEAHGVRVLASLRKDRKSTRLNSSHGYL